MSIIDRICFWRHPQPVRCLHLRAVQRKWNLADGTPMASFRCPECGEHDSGHVQGDSWTEEEMAK